MHQFNFYQTTVECNYYDTYLKKKKKKNFIRRIDFENVYGSNVARKSFPFKHVFYAHIKRLILLEGVEDTIPLILI